MRFKRAIFSVIIVIIGLMFMGGCPSQPDDYDPVITLKGDSNIIIHQGEKYIEAEATATDREDGVVKVTISGDVDSSKVGTYTITYTAIDSDKNKVTETRTVTIIKSTEKFNFKKLTLLKTEYQTDSIINFIFIFEKNYSDFDQVQLFSYVSKDKKIDDNEFEITGYGIDEQDFENNSYAREDYIRATTPKEKGTYFVGLCAKLVWKGSKVAERINICSTPLKINITSIRGEDKTPPVVTIKGDNPVIVNQGSTYEDLGVRAIDNVDGLIDVRRWGDINSIDTSKVKNYFIYYTAKDKAGNETTVERKVIIKRKPVKKIEIIPSTLNLKIDENVILSAMLTYTDNTQEEISGYYVNWKISDDSVAKAIIRVTSNPNSKKTAVLSGLKEGKTTIIATFDSVLSIKKEIIVTPKTIILIDKTPPVITLNGNQKITIFKNTVYNELNATAIDEKDGNVTVAISGNVDTSKIGTYTITYSAKDKVGNIATKERIISVIKNNSIDEKSYFITTWKTDNKGESEDNQINIKRNSINSFNIDWGDGKKDLNVSSQDILHTYDDVGTYTVKIWGDFSSMYFETSGYLGATGESYQPLNDNFKLLSIKQWGKIEWNSMSYAFAGCSNLKIDVSDIPNLSNVKDMAYAFTDNNSSFLKIADWNVSNVTNMRSMFNGARSFNEDISNWNVSKVTDMSHLFERAEIFNKNIGAWNVSNVTNMNRMFWVAKSFNQDIGSWNISKLTKMYWMFRDARAFNQDISNWDVSNVTNMDGLFFYAESFNQDLSKWDVSKVTNMHWMFWYAKSFNQNLNSWDVSNVTNMNVMFSGAEVFNGKIGDWDVSNVTNMQGMFTKAERFNQDISKWNVSNVTDMSRMFSGAIGFNQDLNSWNVSKVSNMSGMFGGATTFDGDVSNWNVSNVTDMSVMFSNATSFNGSIENWNISKLENMDQMLYRTISFSNHDLSSWNALNFSTLPSNFNIGWGSGNIEPSWGKDCSNGQCNEKQVTSLYLSDTNITLREDGKKMLTVLGRYDDGSSKDISSSVEFIVDNSSICSIDSKTVTALSVGSTRLKATLNNITSNEVNITVIEKVDTSSIVKNSLYDQYKHLIPSDSTHTYDSEKFAIITGIAKNKTDAVLENVIIKILNHNEFGSVKTDENGKFSIPIEGGSTFTVTYRKEGYLSLDREVDVAIQNWEIIDTIQMSQLDTKVTAINLSEGKIQIHSSSKINDERGEREATLVFDGVAKATITRVDGTTTELTDIKVRATEFDKPEAMPAKLPEGTAFTYCTALTVDGVEEGSTIEFDKPIVVYIDNFLKFEIGEIVPLGYYNEKTGQWEAYDNGVVIKLLDRDSDGQVDSLDSTGDGIADDLNNDGNFDDEVAGIKDNVNYQVGQSYSRFEVPHFSTYDPNYGSGSNGPPPPPTSPIPDPCTSSCCGIPSSESSDSWIDIQTQTYYEDIPIAGTDMTLNYTSNRVKGYQHLVRIEATTDEVPSDLLEVIVKLEVAGKTYTKVISTKPNQFVEFVWDGMDNNGKKFDGSINALVSVGYKYKAFYLKPPSVRKSFGVYSSEYTDVEADPVVKWRTEVIKINNTISNQQIANGWSLSDHHVYTNGQTLKGDGTSLNQTIELEQGLLSYWRFEDNTKDSSGNGHNGIEEGNITYNNGQIGKAIQFDGKTTLVRTPPLVFTKEFTIAYWLKIDKYVTDYVDHRDNTIFENTKGDTSSSRFAMWFDRNYRLNGFVRRSEYSGEDILSNSTLELNKWNHIIFRKENNQYRIYINGIVDAEKTITFELLQNATFMGLGDDVPDKGNAKFHGALDEFRIYNRALSEDEIKSLYNSNKIESSKNSLIAIEGSLTYIFDIEGKHLQTLDTQTSKVLKTFTYDENSRLILITDRFNNKTTIQRDGEGKITAIIAPNGQTTEIQIDEDSNIGTILYEDGSNYQFSYNDGDSMLIETEPNGNSFKHEFDETGRITKTEDEEGGWKTFTRTNSTYLVQTALGNSRNMTNNGLENQSTSNTGSKSSVVFSNNNMTETVKSCNVETITKYAIDEKTKEKAVKEKSIKLPSGKTLNSVIERSYTFNEDKTTKIKTIKITQNSALTTINTDYSQGISTSTSPMGRVSKEYFDTSTLLPSKSEITGINPTTYVYDTKGRLTSTTTGERTQSITYDSKGNIATITDAEGKVTTMEYDVMDRIVKTTSPLGASLVYSYDNNGNMTMLRTPKSNDHTFTFNKVNKKVGYISAKASSTTYEYDLERKLKKVIYPSGKERENIYTKGLLTSVKTAEGTNVLEYNCLKNITKSTYGSESISYLYDGTLLSSLTYSGLLTKTIGFDYNNDFKLSSISYASATDALTYDKDGLLTKRGAFNITRDTDNGLALALSDGTLSTQRTYNSYGELSEISNRIGSDALFSYSTQRDKIGKITKKVESVAGNSNTYEYRYDNDGRLIEVKKDGLVSESYSYDSNGNRNGSTVNEDDQLLTYKGITYSYNDDGYLSSKQDSIGTTTYEYGIYGELKKVVLADAKVIEYLHNANHQRVVKKVDGTVVEKYLWLDLTTLLATYDKDDKLIQRFEYADNRMPVAMQQDAKKYYLHYDQVGTVKLITDSSGATTKAIEYDSYGNVLTDSNPSFKLPFGFAGGLYDTDTKLTRFGYRDYDSFSGRWTAKDPIGFDGGDSNLYGYVLGDGVNFVDPIGLLRWKDFKDSLKDINQVIKDYITDWSSRVWDIVGGVLSKVGSILDYGTKLTEVGLEILNAKDTITHSREKDIMEDAGIADDMNPYKKPKKCK